MTPVLFRLALIAAGFAGIEVSLGATFAGGTIGDLVGLLLGIGVLLAGTAGFMRPLFGADHARATKGGSDDA